MRMPAVSKQMAAPVFYGIVLLRKASFALGPKPPTSRIQSGLEQEENQGQNSGQYLVRHSIPTLQGKRQAEDDGGHHKS